MKQSKRVLIAAAALALIVLAWTGVALCYLFLHPSLGQWTLIVTAAAIATEVAIWIGAALLGITALQKLRHWVRLRRTR